MGKRNRAQIAIGSLLLSGLLAVSGTACTANNPKSRYLLAERLFSDGKYAAAVTEFERVNQRDPTGKLGLQALFRAAMTQSWYLQQYGEALRNFRLFSEKADDPELSWEAQKQMGELLFSKTEQYEASIRHYRGLLKLRPQSPDAPEFLMRTGRSEFFLWRFSESITTYQELIKNFPQSKQAERAWFEIGNAYYTQGQNGGSASPISAHRGAKSPDAEVFQQAIDAYQRFLQRYPKSEWGSQAKFGIAACLEEQEQLDAAYAQYQALLPTYPSPNVIKIKLARIRQRQTQKKH